MKMFVIIYAEAADEVMIEALKASGILGYTKMVQARGEGTESEPKLGTHIWPGKNNVLFMALPDEDCQWVCADLRRLKAENPRAGIRCFILPMEESI